MRSFSFRQRLVDYADIDMPKERLKMCTRVASSIAYATGFGDSMVAHDEHAYEDRAVALARSLSYRLEPNQEGRCDRRGYGELIELRRNIFSQMPLLILPAGPEISRNAFRKSGIAGLLLALLHGEKTMTKVVFPS